MSDLQARLQTALGSAYRVERELGGGGMSRVYVAEEVSLARKVVVKVLPPEMAAGVNADRFRREIQLAASLQHPHIVPLLNAGQSGDIVWYTMPLIEGESLRARLARDRELPVAEAVRLLRDVADALAYAHEHGVVHRDIKPDNVLITRHHAVVTDFGVAKAISAATGASHLTSIGVALGTPAYMAPEQAAASPHVDNRADLYALGAMAYEMLSGAPPFEGSPQMVLAAHVTQAPSPVSERRAAVPAALATLVMRCLEKKAADRYQSAEELHQQLDLMATPSGGTTPTTAVPATQSRRAVWGGRMLWAVAAAVVVMVGGALLLRDRAPAPLVFGQTRQITLDPGLELFPALSPDGRMVAYTAGPEGNRRIFVRAIAGGSAVPVTQEPQGNHVLPRWSPDGTQLLFHANGAIYVVPALGGAPRVVAPRPDVGSRAYATWSPDGREIAYVEGSLAVREMARLYRRRLDGGEPRLVAEEIEIYSPAWSPDGSRIAFMSGNSSYTYGTAGLGNLGPSAVFVASADGGHLVQVTDRQALYASPTWMPDSRSLLVVSSRGGGRDVYRIRLANDGRASGEPERLTTGLGAGTITLSADGGQLAYTAFQNTANVWAVSIPATGSTSVREAVAITSGSQHIEGLSVTADGKWLAFDSDRSGNADIWKMPTSVGDPVQLTTDPHDDFIPAWSRDGRQIVFQTWRNGNRDVYVIGADGQGEQRVTSDSSHEMYADWSPDGRRIAFYSNRTSPAEVFVVDRTGGGWSQPQQLTSGGGFSPKWSPDGRTIAYIWNGLRAVDVASQQQRSLVDSMAAGGHWAIPVYANWSPDGRVIYVKARDADGVASFWAVPFVGGPPRLLVRFDDPERPSGRQEFATDGRRLFFTIDNRQSDIWVMSVRQGR